MLKQKLLNTSYKHLAKPVLFKIHPEITHEKALSTGRILGSRSIGRKLVKSLFYYEHPSLEQEIFGIKFPNPVGLSAGFDKDADIVNVLGEVGFGFAQIGSITDKPYKGNPHPWVYRLPKSKAFIVNFGLKNAGAPWVLERMQDLSPTIPISISVAKTNDKCTAKDEDGIKDYCACLEKVKNSGIGEFVTINISCPNTFGGEPFTTPEKLNNLLGAIIKVGYEKPIFVKMPINIPWEEFDKLVEVCVKHDMAGVIIGNLNKDRSRKEIVDDLSDAPEKGGISGYPTVELSNSLIEKTYQKYGDALVIIGVGGIFSAEDAYEKIKLGSSLVQLITGMVYEGPQLIGEINKGLVELLKKDGYSNITEAIGTGVRR